MKKERLREVGIKRISGHFHPRAMGLVRGGAKKKKSVRSIWGGGGGREIHFQSEETNND